MAWTTLAWTSVVAWTLIVTMMTANLIRIILGHWYRRCTGRSCSAELARRADQQQAWLDAGDPRGIYGDFMPPAMFLESERIERKSFNDGTPLLARAAAMVKRAEYIEKHWGVVKANIDCNLSIEMLAIQRFLDRCAKREGMTYVQLVDYVRSSAAYRFRSGDGSVPLSELDVRATAHSA